MHGIIETIGRKGWPSILRMPMPRNGCTRQTRYELLFFSLSLFLSLRLSIGFLVLHLLVFLFVPLYLPFFSFSVRVHPYRHRTYNGLGEESYCRSRASSSQPVLISSLSNLSTPQRSSLFSPPSNNYMKRVVAQNSACTLMNMCASPRKQESSFRCMTKRSSDDNALHICLFLMIEI